jgi:hypothetical protein
MNIGGFVAKALPYAKKIGPIAFGAITGALGAISTQKEAKWKSNTDDRLAALEALVKKD